MPESEPIIDAEQGRFMQGGVSIAVGSCDAQNIPSVVRGLGCWIAPDRCLVKVFVARSQASTVLADIAERGAVAVVFNRPTTHRTIQVKGLNAVLTTVAESDLVLIARHEDQFTRELQVLGFSEVFVRTVLAYSSPELVAVEFNPIAAFSQTPGPHAGEPLRAGA